MSLFRRFRQKLSGARKDRSTAGARAGRRGAAQNTRCAPHVEPLEPRLLMAADPLHLGAVYIEEDFGGDDQGDTFEFTFLGGAAGTQLTRLVIDGDQGLPGRTRGDILFDIAPGGLGADQAFPFTVLSLETRDPAAGVSAEVVDGGSQLVLTFTGFVAGDKLVFQIDVDEVEDWNGEEAPLETIN